MPRRLERTLDKINPLVRSNELLLDPSVGRATGRNRMFVFAVLAAVATMLQGLENRPLLIATMTVALAAELFTFSEIPDRHLDFIRQFIDRSVIILAVLAVPELWIAGLVATVSNIVWEFMFAKTRAQRILNVVTVTVVLGTGLLTQQPAAIVTSIVTVLIIALFKDLGRTIRDRLRAGRDDLAQALTTSGSLVHLSDLEIGKSIFVMGPIEEMTGWTEKEWTATSHRDLIHPDDVDGFWVDFDAVAVGESVERSARFRHRNGEWIWLRDVSQVTEENGRRYLRGLTLNTTALYKAQEEIRHQAETDQLTRLANRSVLTTNLERRLSGSGEFALIIFDLNRFKEINDAFGHNFGDLVLRETADRLRTTAAAGDTIARLGGDEFAIVTSSVTDAASADAVALRYAHVLAEPLDIEDRIVHCVPSFGVAIAPADRSCDVNELLHRGDVAMYESKRTGEPWCLFTEALEAKLVDDRRRRREIERGLEADEFELYFQPKIDMTTGAMVGVEGLCRWNHPTEGLLFPDTFIDLVTSSNHAAAFTDVVIDKGLEFAAHCARAGSPLTVAVNVSARSLLDVELPLRLAQMATDRGVEPRQLVIELTEQDIMFETPTSSRVLRQLDQLGVRLSVDDFGTGYSSLSRLIDLPVSEVKIDRRFVSAAPNNVADRVAVQSIIDLAANLGLVVVAEGVESATEAQLLVAAGCSLAQGYWYSKPVRADRIMQLITMDAFPVVGPISA